MDGHVIRGLPPHERAVSIESGGEVGGGASCYTVQSEVMALHHRVDWALQDH